MRKSIISALRAIVGQEHYSIPRVPDELKFGKTQREKQYLAIINELLDVVKKDPMTGLTHKEHFKQLEKGAGVFIMVDGDGLKKINDQFGHAAGHAAILAIAQGIKGAIRKDTKIHQTVTRSGGDEFIIHVEKVSLPMGVTIANRILGNIRNQKISDFYKGDSNIKEELNKINLTASMGVGYTEEDADKAMYKAKQKGRNRVEYYSQILEEKQVH